MTKNVGQEYGYVSDREAVSYPMTPELGQIWYNPWSCTTMLEFDLAGMFDDVLYNPDEVWGDFDEDSTWTGGIS